MRVAIVGAGGHGKVVWDTLVSAGHEVVGFVDDNPDLKSVLGVPVATSIHDLACEGAIVAVGNNRARRRIFEALRREGVPLVNALHPAAVLSSRVTFGEGVLVVAGAIVNVDAHIGDNVILNTGCSIDHDCRIGAHVHVGPGTILAGAVTVEEGAFLGIGTRVIPGLKVGAWSTCGAGSVVIRDVQPDSTVIGVPARSMV